MKANSRDWTSLLSSLAALRRGDRIEELIYSPALTALRANCICLFFYPSLAFVLFTVLPSREDQDGCGLYWVIEVLIKLTITHISL